MNNEEAISFFQEADRRSATGFNRFRRFINNYWLVPLLICYLQLSTQIIYPEDSPLTRLQKGNRAFFQGIPIAYQMVTREFPFTLIGHFYELGLQGAYTLDFFQVPHEDIKTAVNDPETKQAFYDKLVASRDHHESEIGGLLSISYKEGQPVLHLYEIASLNEIYLTRLRQEARSPMSFVDFLQSDQNDGIMDGVGFQPEWIESTSSLIQSSRISDALRGTVMQNFIEMYEALSESRYILSPYQFKAGLGKIPLNERFVGIVHFHNGFNEAPSATDIQQSLRNRQIVFTLSESGWILYDVHKQDLAKVDIRIDNPASLQ